MARLLSAALALLAIATPADLGPVRQGTLRAYVVRHGQSFSNLTPQPKLPPEELDRLTPLGREQARRAGESLRDRGIDLIVTSPKRRTLETAQEISAVLGGVEVRLDERLRPLEMGRGGDGRELEWADRYEGWELGRDAAPDGGESLDALGNRVVEVMRGLRSAGAGRSVLLVTHSEVISNLSGYLAGASLTERFASRIPNGSITVAEWPAAALPRLLLAGFVPPQAAPSPAPGASGARAARPAAHRLAAP